MTAHHIVLIHGICSSSKLWGRWLQPCTSVGLWFIRQPCVITTSRFWRVLKRWLNSAFLTMQEIWSN